MPAATVTIHIYPGELELAIAEHDAVDQVRVFGVPDAAHGERVAAAAITKQGRTLSIDVLRQFLHSRLAQTKIPTELLLLKTLPRTATGKVDLSELKRLLTVGPQ